MKKLLMLLSFAAILGFATACSDDDKPMPPAPTIVLSGANIDQPQEIVEGMNLVINATAEGQIADFTVKIDSPLLNSQTLGALGLSTTMSLTNPANQAMASALKSFGFPVNDEVIGKENITFNLSSLVPMIAQMYNEDSNHNFVLTLTDERGQMVTKTLTCHLSKVPAPTIALEGANIDETQTITADMKVIIKAEAPATIAGFKVKIDSPFLNAQILGAVGLGTELDLVNPGAATAAALKSLGIPVQNDVAGKSDININLSAFMPMIAQMFNETADHKFTIAVTDAKGQTTEKTLTCKSIKVPAPTIALEGADIDEVQEITATMQLIIKVAAPASIAGFTVKIDSPLLTDAILGSMGLSTTLDLVNPSETAAAALTSLGFPVKDNVKGKTELTLSLSQFMPLIAQMYPATSDHKFTINITDAKNQTTSKTIVCHLTK